MSTPASGIATKQLTYAQAIRDAHAIALERDPSVYLLGLGSPDPKGVFGTTVGLAEEFGAERVQDMPTAESGMTGVAIGTAISGMRPVMSHIRVEFALLAVEQIVNQASKWRYMFGGQMQCPLVIRLLVGRGWGQGPQHSQNLDAWFAHMPGLSVVAPTTPADAKGLLVHAILENDDPVVFIEHRWLHGITGDVPEGYHSVPFGQARIAREGTDLTVVTSSHMTLEALRAAEHLAQAGIDVEVVDLRTLRPLDTETILESVGRTGRVIVTDNSWKTGGFAGEVTAIIAEEAFGSLVTAPRRLAMPDVPVPTSPALAQFAYPRARDLVALAAEMLDARVRVDALEPLPEPAHLDQPDPSFVGPF
jgi:acetoin:2,6-dichlorophenolindophenol oxidoreductase subunit beta